VTDLEKTLYETVQALAREGKSILEINGIVFEAFEKATPGEVG
jgi:hypothetical protein